MIAKILHYIWLGETDNFSELQQSCVASWQKHMPEFARQFWNETRLREEFSQQQRYFFELMLQRKKYAFAADYARCLILEKYGGVYLDTDVEVIRNLTPLLDCHAFLGLEDNNRPNCAVLGAVARLPFITALKKAVSEANGLTEIPILTHKVLAAGENLIMDYQQPVLINSVCVYPERYFYPYNPYRKNSAKQLLYNDISTDCFTIHHWGKSWQLTFRERLLRFIKRKILMK